MPIIRMCMARGPYVGEPWCELCREWWQHTPLSESNTNSEHLWFNSVDTDSLLAPVNTVFPQHPPKLFTRNPAIYFPEVYKTCVSVFSWLPGFLENLLESKNLFCSATAATKTALGIIQLCINRVALSFFNKLGIHSSWEVKQRDTRVVGAFTPISLVVYENNQFANFRCPSKTPWHLTHTSQPNHPAF